MEVTLISIFLSLILGFFVNAILNHGFSFLRDEKSFFNKYILFQVILPSFLILYTLLSIIYKLNGVVVETIQGLTLFYLSIILIWYNSRVIKKRKLKAIKQQINDVLIIPWLEQIGFPNANYSTNLYFLNSNIRGEVIIFISADKIKIDQINNLKGKLSERKISLHFRNSNLPKVSAI